MSIVESMLKSFGSEFEKHTGLSEKEAREKLQRHGPNTLTQKKKISAIKILFEQFSDFMILILLASTAISIFMGEMTEAITIIAIVVINAILGFVQEYRTEKTMEALKGLAAPTATVIRENRLSVIEAEKVVPGDLIILEAGDRIPADAILTECKSLNVDESLLTGESVPVEKTINRNENKKSKGKETSNLVFMGTIVTGGRAKGIVYSTGMKTEMGKIADMIQSIEDEETPLQKKLENLGRYIIVGCLFICAIVSLTGILRGEPLFEMLLSGISLAVAAVPEGLPAIVTIALAIGVQRMMKKNALIRKLPAVETLGCATIICSDKTGTLTENKMTVRKIYSGNNIIDVGGNGYSLTGDFSYKGNLINPIQNDNIRFALEIGSLCNNASIIKITESTKNPFGKIKSLVSKEEKWSVSGEPTEIALIIAAQKAQIFREDLEKKYSRIDEKPFDSERKCMSVIYKNQKGEVISFVKGAPDIIINKCSRIYSSGKVIPLNSVLKRSIIQINESMASDALRVLSVAYKKVSTNNLGLAEAETDLVFVGLIGMIDPPRKEAFSAVQKCKLAGIKPIMITGDHKATARAIAKELSIYSGGDKILTGEELEEMNERDLKNVADQVSVYARVSPKHKLMIVKCLKDLGHVVAMTGDGVNDAPAIKEADIGVSMGITGTDVTKQASSMILMDDNFATIVAAVEEGRVIYNNIRKFIRYLLSCNIGEVLTMFIGMLMGLPLPLLPIQILWVNLVTDGLPAIALGLEPADNDIMLRKPRKTKSNIFSDGLLSLIIFRGVFISVCTLAVFVTILNYTGQVNAARTGGFVTLVMTQLIHVFECKSERKNIFEIPFLNNIALILAVACSLTMILSAVYIPYLQGVFKTVSLGLNEWMMIIGFSSLGPVITSLMRRRK